jgi:hypothetical protein
LPLACSFEALTAPCCVASPQHSHPGTGANLQQTPGRESDVTSAAEYLRRGRYCQFADRELVCRSLASYQSTAFCARRFAISSGRSWTTITTAENLTAQNIHIQGNPIRYHLDRLTLEAHLISLLDAALVQQARGVLAGAPVFTVLGRQASDQVRIHCSRWQLDPRRIESEIPSIAELRRLMVRAVPAGTGRGGGWLLTIGLAVLAISVALTSDST